MDVSTLFRVDGMVAVVTGGGTGIGLTMAKALASAGARVYILGRRAHALEAAASSHAGLIPLQCDVTSKASLQGAVDAISKEAGHVNLLVANAGVLGPYAPFDETLSVAALRRRLFDEVDEAAFTEPMRVNATGVFFTIFAFLELLDAGNKNALAGGFGAPARKGGSVPLVQSQVVITSSVGAYSRQKEGPPAYVVSKAAVAHLAQCAATNLVAYQIRVNSLAPGYFKSEMSEAAMEVRDPETEGLDDPGFIPARRFGTDEEMAGAILYLASRAGSFCNGTALLFDGGRLAVVPSSR
ncbi:short-chain dehydrogenase [Nemania sp. NC0429]|nr:short-chain dehydrogenase [Nemania sp. NC0429]